MAPPVSCRNPGGIAGGASEPPPLELTLRSMGGTHRKRTLSVENCCAFSETSRGEFVALRAGETQLRAPSPSRVKERTAGTVLASKRHL